MVAKKRKEEEGKESKEAKEKEEKEEEKEKEGAERLEEAERKWYAKVVPAFKEKWGRMMKKTETYKAFVEGVSSLTGLSEEEVRVSIPASNYKKFQENPEIYTEEALRRLEAAYRTQKWSTSYKEAFRRK